MLTATMVTFRELFDCHFCVIFSGNYASDVSASQQHATATVTSENLEIKGTKLKTYKRKTMQSNGRESDSDAQPAQTKRRLNGNAKPNVDVSLTPWCVPRLRLTNDDRADITDNRMLNDDIIRAFQRLIKQTYTSVLGWQSPAVGAHGTGYSTIPGLSVQIHHNAHTHWLASARTNAGIFVADSLLRAPRSIETVQQFIDIYHDGKSATLDITYLQCQLQFGSIQCGDFAIAWAATFARLIAANSSQQQLVQAFAQLTFDQTKMRDHLLACLKLGTFTMFPPARSAPRLGLATPLTFRINCATGTFKRRS